MIGPYWSDAHETCVRMLKKEENDVKIRETNDSIHRNKKLGNYTQIYDDT